MYNLIKNQWVIVFFLLAMISTNAESQSGFIWGKQFGTVQEEYVLNHVIDQYGNIYVSGKTTGVIDGQNFGKNDGFITKIDSLGNSVCTKQFGTSEDENILWSAIDNNGCVYITGSTKGALNGKNFGKEDIFVVKYNPDGQMEWAKQFGTDNTDDEMNIYVGGSTSGNLGCGQIGEGDCFLTKINSKGDIVWNDLYGSHLGEGDVYLVKLSLDKRFMNR